MKIEKLKLLSILILSISILASSIIISSTLKSTNGEKVLTIEQAAKYLNISTEEMEHIVNYPPPGGFPYLKVNDKYIFTKKALDKLLESNCVYETQSHK